MDKRNFYKGQSVKAEHLNKLQDYSDQGQANLIASLLGYGLVNGFEVSIIEGHIVGVTAGLAFNLAGERLIFAEGQQVNLAQYIPNVGEKTIKLGIIQDFIKTDPATDSMGNTEYTKWVPSVRFITADSSVGFEASRMAFELAEIKINPVSVVEIKATSANFTTLQKQIQNTIAFSTERTHEKTIANINADIFNINKKSLDDIIRDMMYPINSTYTQFSDKATGLFREEDSPLTLFGGDWEEVEKRIYNNVPVVVSNGNGKAWKYPDRRLEFISNLDGFSLATIIYPIPFIEKPFIKPFIRQSNSVLAQSSYEQDSLIANSTEKSCVTIPSSNLFNMIFTSTGSWKEDNAPITPEEEKDYVIIWKKIG